jgi:murein L,D-transpeptidase YafK
MGSGRRRLAGVLLCVAALTGMAVAQEKPWILVDTAAGALSVRQDGQELARFDHIAIGRGGAASLRRKGDGTTPLGSYRVAWINEDSPFHRFFGIDFPSRPDAERAREAGVIDDRDLRRITAAIDAGRIPPQDTPLGGRLGIHGIGRGDLRMHRDFNWTQGCIALTNEEIEALSRWVVVGTPVVVR